MLIETQPDLEVTGEALLDGAAAGQRGHQVALAQSIAPIVCVQATFYNLAHRDDDDLIDSLAAQGIANVPYFPLGGLSPLQSGTLESVANVSTPHRWPSRWRGCSSAHRTSCSFPAPHPSHTCATTLPALG